VPKELGLPFDSLISTLFDQNMLCFRTLLRTALIAGSILAGPFVAGPQNASAASPFSARPDTISIAHPRDVIEAVVQNNRSLESLIQNASAASSRSGYVGAFPDPTLMVTGQPMPVYTARGKQVVQIRAEQMIPYPGKLRLMEEMADLEAELGRDMVQIYAVEALLEAQLAVNEHHRIEATKKVVTAFSDRLAEYEGIAIRKYEGGAGDPSAVLKLQMEQSRLVQTLIDLGREQETTRYRVEKVVQLPVRIEERSESESEIGSSTAAVRGPLDASSRDEVKALERKEAMVGVRSELLDFYNRPDFGVSINWIGIVKSDMPASSDGRDALALGVAVRIPLGQSANKAKKQEAELQRSALASERLSVIHSIETVYANQTARTQSDLQSLRHLESSLLPAAEALLSTSISAYSNGKGDLLDLLDAERSRFQLEKERVDIKARIDAGNLILSRVSGELSAIVSTYF
jgi:hypothetical protein